MIMMAILADPQEIFREPYCKPKHTRHILKAWLEFHSCLLAQGLTNHVGVGLLVEARIFLATGTTVCDT